MKYCPICHRNYCDYPAISRKDNKTEICPDCGMKEALDDMYANTKNAQVRRLISEKRYKEALQICKDWNYTEPSHRGILQRGYECLVHPDFYKQLGFNPDIEYQKAVNVLIEVYHDKD